MKPLNEQKDCPYRTLFTQNDQKGGSYQMKAYVKKLRNDNKYISKHVQKG